MWFFIFSSIIKHNTPNSLHPVTHQAVGINRIPRGVHISKIKTVGELRYIEIRSTLLMVRKNKSTISGKQIVAEKGYTKETETTLVDAAGVSLE